MMYVDFSSVKEKDLVSVYRSDMIEVTTNSIFETPHEFIPSSFKLSVRGVDRTMGPSSDFELINNNRFIVKCHLSDIDNIVATYLKK